MSACYHRQQHFTQEPRQFHVSMSEWLAHTHTKRWAYGSRQSTMPFASMVFPLN